MESTKKKYDLKAITVVFLFDLIIIEEIIIES